MLDQDQKTQANLATNPILQTSALPIEQYGHLVAENMPSATKKRGEMLPILKHVDVYESAIRSIHQHFSQLTQENAIVSYAKEWLLDNYYLVQHTIQQVCEDLPPKYYSELPKLTSDLFVGYPRIYAVARFFTSYKDEHLTHLSSQTFLISFQEQVALTMGELWAWPTMLRLCALENLICALENIANIKSFSQFLPTKLLDQFVESQTSPQLMVANSITNLRLLDTRNWLTFFESVSRVETLLRRDPAGIYPIMDFKTRNQYRLAIEHLAAVADVDEEAVAQLALKITQQTRSPNERETKSHVSTLEQRQAHIGYYLIDRGYQQLEKALNCDSKYKRIKRWVKNHILVQIYIGVITLITLMITIAASGYAATTGGSLWQIIMTGIIVLIPASAIAVPLINWFLTKQLQPSHLPKLDFSVGILSQYRTAVVIPILLTDMDEIETLFAQLEQHYLRNTDVNLRFVLLADFIDAPNEQMPEDDALVERAKICLDKLNKRYEETENQPFYFFLRRRLWNSSENQWMGYERKRGKLAEFNQLLLDPQTKTSYFIKCGDLISLVGIRFVITLDADTVMPHKAAHCLIGTLAHPLNQAVFDSGSEKVIAGYTILQPRIELLPTLKNRTLFAHIMSGDTGFDLYTLAVSNVYQDVFDEGIYVGKGIYDVAAFERGMKGRVPENALLSHDLFEGIHGRAGLVTDIVLIEDYPSHYIAFTKRLHRWIRGDWQLLPWILPRVPDASGTHINNSLSGLSLWKIVDNLRRSIERPALLLLFLAGWLWLPGSAFVWTVFGMVVLWVPYVLGMVMLVKNQTATSARLTALQETRLMILVTRWGLTLSFLLYESLLVLDAMVRTLYRLKRRTHLLEWTTAAATMQIFEDQTHFSIWRQMRGSFLLTILVMIAILLLNPTAILPAFPLLVIWILAPYFAQQLSHPHTEMKRQPSVADTKMLHILARRTWLFFEAFVGPADHWLPPDNFQNEPVQKLKHYTSPTNIGLMLISTMAAYDMGYIGLIDLMLRLQFAFDSIDQLERHHGHLLNWHHTQSLKALIPRYVSTVDSGNYAGSLLALKEGTQNLLESPVISTKCWQGLGDTLDVITEILSTTEITSHSDLFKIISSLRQHIISFQDDPSRWVPELNNVIHNIWPTLTVAIDTLVSEVGDQHSETTNDLHIYLRRMHHHVFSMQRDIESLLPWLILFQRIPATASLSSPYWNALQDALKDIPYISNLNETYIIAQTALTAFKSSLPVDATEEQLWCQQFADALHTSETALIDILHNFEAIQNQIERDFEGMDFGFLYDKERHLFHIGYSIDNEQVDSNHYDLLASEARLASYIAIAKGDVPYKHWLHLGRPMAMLHRRQVLYSWSGTIFEYLMPLLLMRQESNTLLGSSTETAIAIQIDYATRHHTPWGISESGYYVFDMNHNYQYRAFGVPDLALKRGQELDHVIAPYASVLALSLRPAEVIENLNRFFDLKAINTYGLIEAIDYTTNHLPLGKERALVHEYMAHHQGMIFVALTNFLQHDIMVHRFHADPRVNSVELLLLEQIPTEVVKADDASEKKKSTISQLKSSITGWQVPIDAPIPEVHYLSNGRYKLMITSAGSGYSQWQERALTRWRADTTLDDWGMWFYIRDDVSGALWSAGYQPIGDSSENIQTIFHPHKAEFIRREFHITSRLEIVVAPNDDLEIRRLTLTNHSGVPRYLTICSYSEIVLAEQKDDNRHQAFNKLFIESEYVSALQALIFHRRRRSVNDESIYVLHRVVHNHETAPTQYETDRARFLGRNGSTQRPQALQDGQALSGTVGSTLDPIMALSQEIEIEPHSTIHLAFLTIAGNDRSELVELAHKYDSLAHIDYTFNQARHYADRELLHLGLDAASLKRIQTLLSSLLYPHPILRAPEAIVSLNTQAQDALWSFGISGDYPIILVKVNNPESLGIVQELVSSHIYWRNRGIQSTLIILNTYDTGYQQFLHNQLQNVLSRLHSEIWLNRSDGIFMLRNDQLTDANRILLQSAARIYLDDEKGTLAEQLAHLDFQPINLPAFIPTHVLPEIEWSDSVVERAADLKFDNGYGGFTADGHEYVIYITSDQPTPAPWSNVIANENAGFIVTESGGGFSWAYNSGENRLTQWRNDPVVDVPSEVIYLRDEETGTIWSPTPQPASTDKPYCVRHGAGYTVFEHQSYGIEQTLRYYVAPNDPVKFVRLRLKNTSPRARRITITHYAEWVLGPTRDITQQYLIPVFDVENQTILIRNPYSIEFGDHHAFITANKAFHGLTTDRTEFLGRMGSYSSPAGLYRIGLSGTVSSNVDPCTSVQLHVDLPIAGDEEVCFVIGQGTNYDMALELSKRYRKQPEIETAWTATIDKWRNTLDSIIVRTPDPAMNMILPWLLYQSLSCRIWGRSALYQSSGAYGFRDQLQDVMSLIHAHPDLARQHILRAAQHQFKEGDVLHWWHPPSGRGVRTRFSDDLLWLPFVVAHYVNSTGDQSILNEEVPFLVAEPLGLDEEERYGFYGSTDERFTIYEHCQRAIEKGSTSGIHGLPLMKAGDWNDGMNRVGIKGKGESVWMAWFLYSTIAQFLPLCDIFSDHASMTIYQERMSAIQTAITQHGWDGAWYRRAYYDNGMPLGSNQNMECKIDSLVQSWSVISGAADPAKAQQAMQSVDQRLVDESNQLIKLFTPPFNHTPEDPGYIKGYPPGIRENGGQYTHAALWFVWALTEMQQGHRAQRLFSLLNPINHSNTQDKALLYRVEPYVVAADIYGEPPYTGRGGWTWYTGSSAWMYRLAIEAILGIHREGSHLRIEPNISRDWTSFEIDYRYGTTIYHIRVENPNGSEYGVATVSVDGKSVPSNSIALVDDHIEHYVIVLLE